MVPAVKTRLLFRAPTIHGHNRRTGLPSRLPTRSTVTSTGCITNLHSSRGRSDEQRRTSRIRKGELTRRRSLAPVPAPLIISEGIYFFLRTHPLEVRWSWNRGAAAIPVVFSNPWTPSLRRSLPLWPSASVVPIGDTREESTAGKEIGPAGPQIPPEAS